MAGQGRLGGIPLDVGRPKENPTVHWVSEFEFCQTLLQHIGIANQHFITSLSNAGFKLHLASGHIDEMDSV